MGLLDADPAKDNQPDSEGSKQTDLLGGKPNGEPAKKDSEPAMPEWLKDAPEPLQKAKSLYKFKSREAALSSYLELEGKLGKSVEIPGKEATKEEWAKFYQRIGRPLPASADEYEVPVRDADLSKVLRKAALDGELSKDQAKMVASAIEEYEKSREKKQGQAYTEEATKADRLLRERYGAQYEARMGYAKRAFEGLFGEDTRAKLSRAGLSSDAGFISVLSDLGAEMREDSLVKGKGAPADEDVDPYTKSMAELLARRKR